jgi:hypothetical protein
MKAIRGTGENDGGWGASNLGLAAPSAEFVSLSPAKQRLIP